MDGTSQIAKIKLRVGSMELEYEGEPSFLTGGIEALLVTMGTLAEKIPGEPTPEAEAIKRVPQATSEENGASSTGKFSFSTNTIAAHLEAKTGPDLAICAIAQLELVQGKSSSTRSDILAEMKSATSYYSETIRSNLSATLSNLTRSKRINQVGKDTYALSATERKQLEAKLANIQ